MARKKPTKNMPACVVIPVTREKSHHITVVARLGGRAARFVVDTGAGATIVDAAAAARYKLELFSAARKGGGVGSAGMHMNRVKQHDLSLGDLDLSGTQLLTLDLSHVNHGLKQAKVKPVVGVLGADVLWSRQAVIDYARGVLLLSK